MEIELEDNCSYEIFTFIYHLLVTSGTSELGHGGKDKKAPPTSPRSLRGLFICKACFVVSR